MRARFSFIVHVLCVVDYFRSLNYGKSTVRAQRRIIYDNRWSRTFLWHETIS